MNAFALVDCNNFFVSCERVFRPALERRPVVVLSNNDGVVISRSEEAKALGIGMAVPFFEVKALCAEHRVAVISANHELYVDFSKRVGEVLERHAPIVENYSIDESFLTLPDDGELPSRARAIRAEVGRWTGIPVSVGLAPTKALAKLASDKAKKAGGVLSLLDASRRALVLAETPVEHIWGIARRSADKLAEQGARTAAEFADLDDAVIQKVLGVGAVRLAHELRGISCLTLAAAAPERQSITVSRSFGRPVASLAALEAAVASFAVNAAERARRHELKAGALSVFVGWREDGKAVGDDAGTRLTATDDTGILVRAAKDLIAKLFVEGRDFRKAGIVLSAMEAADTGQAEFFEDGRAEKSRRLLKTMDRLNASLGPGTVVYGGAVMPRANAPKQETRSPRWTTVWDELPVVRV